MVPLENRPVFQIFELEEEIMNTNMSALDMRGLRNLIGEERRESATSEARFLMLLRISRGKTLNHNNLESDNQATQMRLRHRPVHLRLHTATTRVRGRLSSMVHKGAEIASTFTSPLAQLYQPLVVDDDLVDEQAHSTPPKNQGMNAPGLRRRLSSMHRFPPMPPLEQYGSPNASRSGPLVLLGRRISENLSPFGEYEEGDVHIQSPDETAEQVIEGEEDRHLYKFNSTNDYSGSRTGRRGSRLSWCS